MYAKDQDSVGKWNNSYLSNKNCLTIRAEHLAKQILTFHSAQTHMHTHIDRQINRDTERHKRQTKLYV